MKKVAGLSHFVPSIWLSWLIVSITFFAAIAVMDFLPLPEPSPELQQKMATMLSRNILVNILMLCIVTPLIEELLCRRIILNILLKHLRPWLAILISAGIFGAMHGNIWQAVPAALLGVFLGWTYFRLRSYWLCVLLHALNNTATLLIFIILGERSITLSLSEMVGGGVVSGIVFAVAICVLIGGIYIIQNNIPLTQHNDGESDLPL